MTLTLLRLFYKLKSNESRCIYPVAWCNVFSMVVLLDKGADDISTLPGFKYHLMSMEFMPVFLCECHPPVLYLF